MPPEAEDDHQTGYMGEAGKEVGEEVRKTRKELSVETLEAIQDVQRACHHMLIACRSLLTIIRNPEIEPAELADEIEDLKELIVLLEDIGDTK